MVARSFAVSFFGFGGGKFLLGGPELPPPICPPGLNPANPGCPPDPYSAPSDPPGYPDPPGLLDPPGYPISGLPEYPPPADEPSSEDEEPPGGTAPPEESPPAESNSMEPPLEPPDELEPPDGAVEDDGALAAIGVSFFPHPTAKKQHTTEAINNHGRNMAVSNKFQKFQSAASPR
jgi:hypothetical protein